jgi:hypothetical protein
MEGVMATVCSVTGVLTEAVSFALVLPWGISGGGKFHSSVLPHLAQNFWPETTAAPQFLQQKL